MNWYTLFFGEEEIFFLLEIVMIIALGSAAGDPMIYKEIGIAQALVVFTVVLISYKIITYLITKSKKIESFLEGKAIYIIHNGHAALESFNHTDLAMDEFFAELRVLNIEHLGQVKEAILETNGYVSILFYDDKNVKHGLPIWPKEWAKKSDDIKVEDIYACSLCGFTLTLPSGKGGTCPFCKKNKEWVKAIDNKRVV